MYNYKSASGQLENGRQLQTNTVNDTMSISINFMIISKKVYYGVINSRSIKFGEI